MGRSHKKKKVGCYFLKNWNFEVWKFFFEIYKAKYHQDWEEILDPAEYAFCPVFHVVSYAIGFASGLPTVQKLWITSLLGQKSQKLRKISIENYWSTPKCPNLPEIGSELSEETPKDEKLWFQAQSVAKRKSKSSKSILGHFPVHCHSRFAYFWWSEQKL